MKAGRTNAPRGRRSDESGPDLSAQVGDEIVRFQEASKTIDQVAAAILRLDQQDLPCMTRLLFGGPATAHQLAEALRLPLSTGTRRGGQARAWRATHGARPALADH